MRNLTTTAVAFAVLLSASPLLAAETSSTTTGTTSTPATTTGAPSATGTSTSGPATPGAAATSGTSSAMMNEMQVKQKLESEGYTGVTGLKEESNGMWMGKAMHAGKQVTVDVDKNGNVTAK